jgi:hypothetical protein
MTMDCRACSPRSVRFSVLSRSRFRSLFGGSVVFYLIVVVVAAHALWALKQMRMLSLAVKLIAVIVLLHTWLSTTADVIHFGSYASNGVGLKFFLVLAEILDTAAQSSMMIVLMLLAQGWCVTSATVRDPTASRCVAVLVVLVYVVLFFWRVLGESRESTLYYYESMPGAFALVLRMLFCAYFVLSLRLTWREETNPEDAQLLPHLWRPLLPLVRRSRLHRPHRRRHAARLPRAHRRNDVHAAELGRHRRPRAPLPPVASPTAVFEIGGTRESLLAKSATNTSYTAL